MIEELIYPFNVCKYIFSKDSEKRRLRMRKGDVVEVPPFDEDPMSSYSDLRNTVHSSIQVKSFNEILSNMSFENRTPRNHNSNEYSLIIR